MKLFGVALLTLLLGKAAGQCSFTIQFQTEPACPFAFDGVVIALPTGGIPPFTFQWEIDTATSNQLTGLDVGTYSITVTDASGCAEVDSIELTAATRPPVSSNATGVSCFGVNDGQLTIIINDASLQFSLLGAAPSSQTYYDSLWAGGYQYFVQDTFGCEWLQFFNIDSPDKIKIELPSNLETQRCDSVQIEAIVNVEPATFAWSPPDFLSCTTCPNPIANPFASTVYHLTVADSNGCAGADSVRVRVGFEERAHIPNAFSPNGDGMNETFFVLGNCVEEVKLLRIFDRWGQQVFEASNVPPSDPQFGWDGKYRGKEATSDVYIYSIIVLMGNGTQLEYKGDLTLLR